MASIALVGMPGSGKSTVGAQLARQLDVPCIDSDAEIEEHLGESIRSFFDRKGEAAFRDIETEVIRDLLASGKEMVLATGGGAVLREENRRALREGATVVYLRSSPDELFRRLRHDTKRPLLQVRDPLKKLRELYAQRDPLYRETAHYVMETGRPSVHALVNMVLMQLELGGVISNQRVKATVGASKLD